MNLVKFIDCRFQELRLKEQEEQTKQTYSITRDSEVLALQSVLKGVRTLTKWAMVPKVLFHYFMVLIGNKPKPEPVLLNKLKADVEKDREEKARKVGMLDKLKKEKEAEAASTH